MEPQHFYNKWGFSIQSLIFLNTALSSLAEMLQHLTFSLSKVSQKQMFTTSTYLAKSSDFGFSNWEIL